MSRTMKALYKKDLTPGVIFGELPIPEPKEGEVLVRVRAAGICGSDVHMYEGAASYKVFEQFMPLILGHEFCGDVAELGKGVTSLTPGMRVVCRAMASCGHCRFCRTDRRHFCSEGFQNILGLQRDGGFAEYVAVPASYCIPMPDSVSYEMGALIEPMGVTANAVNDSDLAMGETVVVQGPGPIGLLTLLFAKARGAGTCMVIGTSQDSLRLAKARELGADHIILADKMDAVQTVLDLTGGTGVNVVFEASGVPSLIQSAVNMCDKTGRVVLEGIYGSPGQVDFTSLVRTAKRLIGTYGGVIAWDRLLDWIGADSLYRELPLSVVTHRSSLTQADEAFTRSVRKENIKELFIFE